MFFDSLCFLIGKSRFGVYIEKRFFIKNLKKIDSVNKNKAFFYILATKFVYGTRIASLIYYGIRGLSYRRFLIYDFGNRGHRGHEDEML